MSYGPVADEPSLVAKLDTDLTTAQAIADHVAERFAPEDIAVSLPTPAAGAGRSRSISAAAPSEDAVRAAVAAAAGAEAAAALRFGSAASKRPTGCGKASPGWSPVAAGRFIVHGAHDRARVPANRIGIEIEAALAFGTGHHGTTRGCLLALDAICKAAE